MAYYFVKTTAEAGGATPSDSNDGLDVFGFALTGAIWTESSKQLSSTGAFSSYNWTSGDQIYISGGTGVTTGLYEINSKIDSDTIDLVTDLGGNGDTSDVSSASGPFATVDKGATTAGSGDIVYICDDGTHSPTVKTTFSTTYDRIMWGADSRGIPYTTSTDRATIDGGSLAASTDMFLCDVRVHWHNLTLTSATGKNISTGTGTNGNCYMYNCRITAAGSDGISGRSSCYFYNVEVDNNGGIGCGNDSTSTSNRVSLYLNFCSIHDNTSDGCRAGLDSLLHHTLIYDNGGDGYVMTRTGDHRLVNCTIDKNTGSGFKGTSTYASGFIRFINTVFSNNGAYGVDLSGSSYPDPDVEIGTTYYNNTSGAANGYTIPSDAGTSDPKYTTTTNGSEDYTPQSTSPLIDFGLAPRTA